MTFTVQLAFTGVRATGPKTILSQLLYQKPSIHFDIFGVPKVKVHYEFRKVNPCLVFAVRCYFSPSICHRWLAILKRCIFYVRFFFYSWYLIPMCLDISNVNVARIRCDYRLVKLVFDESAGKANSIKSLHSHGYTLVKKSSLVDQK